jgi:transcriptional regulator GlxA family with amidase domain
MAYLRTVRMQRVREDLLKACDGDTVSAIATRWGFFEFGRFAGQYRKLYGETPSETLRRR